MLDGCTASSFFVRNLPAAVMYLFHGRDRLTDSATADDTPTAVNQAAIASVQGSGGNMSI